MHTESMKVQNCRGSHGYSLYWVKRSIFELGPELLFESSLLAQKCPKGISFRTAKAVPRISLYKNKTKKFHSVGQGNRAEKHTTYK